MGVGTGSTANYFIDALAQIQHTFDAAVASSEETQQRLVAHGITVLDLNATSHLDVYVDGADEIDALGNMIKGGGAALAREKIVASAANEFVCIADDSKLVETLGTFPLPVEVIPMAMGITSTGRGKVPSVSTNLLSSAMQTNSLAALATIFSRANAAPPPLIMLPSASISSAPST